MLWIETLIAALAVAGLFFLIVAVTGGFLTASGEAGDSAVTFYLRAQGDANDLERQIIKLLILRRLFFGAPNIVIFDMGLSSKGKQRAAELSRHRKFVSLAAESG